MRMLEHMSSFLIKKKNPQMFFAESSVGDSGFQAWGNATPGESEEDRQTDRQVQTAGWLGWGLGSPYTEAAILLNSGKF